MFSKKIICPGLLNLKIVTESINSKTYPKAGYNLKMYKLNQEQEQYIHNQIECINHYGWISWVTDFNGLKQSSISINKYIPQFKHETYVDINQNIDICSLEWITTHLFEDTEYDAKRDHGHSGGSMCWTKMHSNYIIQNGVEKWFGHTSGPFGYLNPKNVNINHMLSLLNKQKI
jgi:hypothetical protein